MILKIATGDGWKFIDKVEEVFVEKFSVEKYNKQMVGLERTLNDSFLFYNTISQEGGKMQAHGPEGPSLANNDAVSIAVFRPKMNDGEIRTYIADLAVYLLSDEGKTIERIN